MEALAEGISMSNKPKPVAWMTEDGRVSMDATKQCMPKTSRDIFCIPLYDRNAVLDEARKACWSIEGYSSLTKMAFDNAIEALKEQK
jgi:hypothetical protein